MVYGGAALGGAVCNQAGNLEINNSALVFNHAKGGPSGFWMFMPGVSGSGDGGGILNRGELSLVNCTIAENDASPGDVQGPLGGQGWTSGGGISGNATLLNVTLARNSVQSTNGRAWGSSIYGTATLTNTLLFCLPGQTNVAGTIADGGHNICSDASAAFSAPTSHNDLDPLLGPVADNGGLTATVALLPRSPALNAADPAVCPAVDQRGVRRPTGSGCDIGAFELALTLAISRLEGARLVATSSFEPDKTNQFSASTDLTRWVWLGTRVADADGKCEFEDAQGLVWPQRFYRVQVDEP